MPTRKRSFEWDLGVKPNEYIGWVPSPMRVVHRMLELAEIQPGETVYDLGCGDGRFLIAAARKYGARGVGIDLDRHRLAAARQRAEPWLDRLAFRRQNLFKTDLRRADVVILYLLPVMNAKLMRRLRKLKAGVRIVTQTFDLPGIVPYKVAHLTRANGRAHDIFAYKTPLQKGPAVQPIRRLPPPQTLRARERRGVMEFQEFEKFKKEFHVEAVIGEDAEVLKLIGAARQHGEKLKASVKAAAAKLKNVSD